MAYAQDKGSGKERKRPSNIVRFWTTELAAARRREKDYRKEGKRIREIYNGQKRDTFPFNILYSNTETLLPALYGATPKPIVQRRFKDADPVGRAAAMAGQRILEFLIDTNGGNLLIDIYADEEEAPFKSNVLLQPSTETTKAREWITMTVDNEANFMTIAMKQSSAWAQVRITSIRIHCSRGGYTSG